jgi:peptidoglycan biosynthesis protein MviN/MurJ (putative lipid II flippase)
MAVTSLPTALIVHALAAPIFFTLVSLDYFTRFNAAKPGQTALIFAGVTIGANVLVGLPSHHGAAALTNLLGTWIPFALILAATYLTGRCLAPSPVPARAVGLAQRVME